MELADFMEQLKSNKAKLTRQQFRTLKGQAIAGDVDAAQKGLNKLMNRRGE